MKAPYGWKLVPLTPTVEMRAAAGRTESEFVKRRATFFAGDAYEPMIDATPEYEPELWTGEGLPPVGTVCEVNEGISHKQVEVIAHFRNAASDVAVYIPVEPGQKFVKQAIAACFRPIRTVEQIAADAREKAIAEILEIVGPNWRNCAAALIDAGYTKP